MRRAIFFGITALTFGSVAFACSLDLDESLITKPKEGGAPTLDAASLPDGTVITESGVPIIPDAGACAKDEECIAANACLKGKCDLTRKACTYEICRPTACNVGTCDQAAKSCSAPAAYKLRASEMTLDQPAGTIVAAYPWLFTLTATGVLAYNISNPANAKPTQVPVVGVGFLPNQLVRSGNRIWMTGPMQGSPARLPLAYIDVSADPFTAKMQAQTVLATYNRPAEGFTTYARDNKSIMLVGPGPTFPTTTIDTSIAEPASVAAAPLAPVMNTSPIAVSGTRLLMRSVVAGAAGFNFITNAGSGNPANTPSITVTDAGEASVVPSFASSVDGTIFWAVGVHAPNPLLPPPGGSLTRAVRGYFLVTDANTDLTPSIKGVDIEVYKDPSTSPPPNSDIIRGAVLIDSSTAMVAVASADNLALTAIQFIKRDPLSVMTDKRFVIPSPVTSVSGATASDGIAYIAFTDPAVMDTPAVTHVYVIDPACAP